MSLGLCGALSKSTQTPCKNIAGKGTDHFGEGRCRLHGGATPIKHGLYSRVRRTRLGKRIAEIENDPHILDLSQELAVLKVLAEQAVEAYQEHEAALQSWYRAESPLYNKLLGTSDAREICDSVVALRSVGLERPKELPDAKIITTIIAEIGRTQDRIRQAETVVTRDQMIRLFDRMAGVVRQYTDDQTLQRIREGWMNLPREDDEHDPSTRLSWRGRTNSIRWQSTEERSRRGSDV